MNEFHHHGISKLDHWGLIRAHGEDAVKFLHGQLTHDLVLLPTGQARMAAYCSPKGRMLASFIAIKRAEDDVWLLVARDLLATTLKRLQMFVMRSKVRLTDESANYTVYGRLGNACQSSPEAQATAPWQAWATSDGGHIVCLYPSQGLARQVHVAPSLLDGADMEVAVWECSEVLSGVAWVQASTIELFVPQMLNYESIGGVSFKKGCYPGQEVVARSQFRGTLKRRTYLARSAVPLQPGQEVLLRDDPQQSAGTVAAAAPDVERAGHWVALLCLQTQWEGQALATAEYPDAQIELLALPYSLLADV
ncbi:folate-binding protein [Curvibacter sp. APW13]|uniref:CAF17-like 4Fe-4S cluster assembly/insertion protein YgfZ n=1 Tax=Curvibacter sp. APW13 TaxID=3077236 RepID=UPI0028DE48C0|nr:folate-binding protein [Curvibacter sp. APW13]MDT8991636.1 folate-binding protein [Curvibacter sp. APW13]